MLNNSRLIYIDLTPEYRRNLKDLAKKYRNIRSDTQSIIEDLQQGIVVGDRLAGFGSEIYVYKLRVKNSNIQKGKSGGYRLIYYLQTATSIILLTVYSKSDQEDIAVTVIQGIIEQVME
jgi:mRNA-degrading endonuclease RelE of RelBE toxin-antitoxin system